MITARSVADLKLLSAVVEQEIRRSCQDCVLRSFASPVMAVEGFQMPHSRWFVCWLAIEISRQSRQVTDEDQQDTEHSKASKSLKHQTL